jgi:hypothetical protein
MNPPDLTRWNRAGLSRFRYVDANAATHLEALRIELAARFADWDQVRNAAPPDETEGERAERLLKQYHAVRRDWAWETTRAFARALHILTEHIDAFANEGYLRTATQWQSVRRLAAMVGYAPAPASSATTPLVLVAKSEVTNAKVERGFAVKHVPAGAPPVIFETLEDVDIAAALNELRLAGWNTNPTLLRSAQVWPVPKGLKISAGDLAILAVERADAAVPVSVKSVSDAGLTLAGPPPVAAAPRATPELEVPARLTLGRALLHVAPTQILVPSINGRDVVRVSPSHDLAAGDVVAWKTDDAIHLATVVATEGDAVRLQSASGERGLPAKRTALFRAAPISFEQFKANSSEWRLASSARSVDFRVGFAGPDGRLHGGLAASDLTIETPTTDGVALGYTTLGGDALAPARRVWFVDPGNDTPVTTVAAARRPMRETMLHFAGKPPALVSGDPVIVQTASEYLANRIERIEKSAGGYRIVFAAAFTGSVAAIHAAFAATLRPAGHDADPRPVPRQDLALQLAGEWPALLTRGRRLVLESASGAFDAFAAEIAASDPQRRTIRIDPPVAEPAAVRRGDLVIRANVVVAGHGETKPVRVLGSGDASATNQRFVIEVDDVSHVRDPSLPAGVRADVDVDVEHERYRQVESLRDSGPADPHYVVRITETGTLELQFGDGRHGRRLPSGANNVLATIRRGSGLGGNLPVGALTDIVKKHPAIESFRHAILAAGGDDRESVDQIRQNAAGRLTAMDRAISVADFERLAQRFQGVWHAAAFEQPAFGRSREAVRLVIVPAGGGELGSLADDVRAYLVANGLPSIDIAITPFQPLPVEIAVTARVDTSRFDPRQLEGRVAAAVLAAFDLRLRRPGQPVYRSEVTRVVEGTEGVTNSDVVLFESDPPADRRDWERAARGDDGGIWAVFPKDDQVIYARRPELVTVTAEEATI